MERKLVTRTQEIDSTISFDDLEKEMSKFKDKYPDAVAIADMNILDDSNAPSKYCLRADSWRQYDDTFTNLQLECDTYETDEELADRIKREELNRVQELELKRIQFERLKEELGECN